MLELTLTPRRRRQYLVAAVLLGLPGAYLTLLWLGILATAIGRVDVNLQPVPALLYITTCMLATGVATLFVAVALFRAYWAGTINRAASGRWAAGVGVAYVGLLGWLFMLMARHMPDFLRDEVLVFGFVLLLYAAVAWVRQRVTSAETKTAEKLLEIELRLAEMGETLQTQTRVKQTSTLPGSTS